MLTTASLFMPFVPFLYMLVNVSKVIVHNSDGQSFGEITYNWGRPSGTGTAIGDVVKFVK
jgi:hypothetical protein